MEKRSELKQLVVYVLNKSEVFTAHEMYELVKTENPHIMVEEKVRGFKSFVKIVNTFPEVKSRELKKGEPNIYSLK